MKIFRINFLIFSILLVGIYLLATSKGAPGLPSSDIPIVHAILGGFFAVSFFSFWVTMLVHCVKTAEVKSKFMWILGMVFLPWIILVIYFFVIYIRENKKSSMNI